MNVYPLVKLTLASMLENPYMWKNWWKVIHLQKGENFPTSHVTWPEGFFFPFLVAICGHPTACLFAFLRPISGHNLLDGIFWGISDLPFLVEPKLLLSFQPNPWNFSVCLSQNLWEGSEMNFQMWTPISLPNEKKTLPSGELRMHWLKKKITFWRCVLVAKKGWILAFFQPW